MTTDRVIAQWQVLDYAECIGLIRARVEATNVPHEQLEDHMGIAKGSLGKILGAGEVRRIGLSLIFRVLEGLGYRMWLHEHLDIAAALDEMSSKLRARKRGGPGRGKLRRQLSPAIITAAAQVYGAMGMGCRKTFRDPKKAVAQRRKAGKAGALARWAKVRATPQHHGVSKRPALHKVKTTKQFEGITQ